MDSGYIWKDHCVVVDERILIGGGSWQLISDYEGLIVIRP